MSHTKLISTNLIFIASLLLGLIACTDNTITASSPVDVEPQVLFSKTDVSIKPINFISLPAGFDMQVYADNVKNARQMALGDKGTLFVGSRRAGNVYALLDADKDNIAEKIYVIAKGLKMPTGVAFKDGSLYVGAVNRILRFDDIENHLQTPPKAIVVSDAFPSDEHHGWKYLGIGPDNKMYVPVGAPCNICDEEGYAEIKRMNLDGSDIETFAQGVRNSVGFDWHPGSNELWFTDNGRDRLGNDSPDCELNHAPKSGLHFGFPYCHASDVLDPKFGGGKSCTDYESPQVKLGPHVAPLGMKFYTGEMFPDEYKNNAFIAEHGSWNRDEKIGYRIKRVEFDEKGKASKQSVFAHGWLSDNKKEVLGRPNDVLIMPDGSMLVSDDQANKIYRITYSGR